MSRAMNVTANKVEVAAMCAKHSVGVSVIETLLSGGTRVVLDTGEDADVIRHAFRTRIIAGPVKRSLWVRNG